MIRFLLTVFSLVAFAPALAGDLIETNSDFDGLPEVVEFDCFPNSDSPTQFFEPLHRRMRIPKNFEQSQSDPDWINWNVRILGDEGESAVFPFAAIQFGELDVGIKWIEQEFTVVSRAADNGFGVDVYLSNLESEDFGSDRWLFLVREDKFLKVIARAEIDWNSLLACFE